MKRIISIMLVFGALLTSCGKFFDINKDPNNPATAGYPYVLPAAVASSAAVVGGQYTMLGSLWSQHFTQNPTASQYQDLDGYFFSNNKFPRVWREVYAGALNDYAEVIRQSAEAEDWATHLMGVTMRCYTFALMADLYDSVPYTDALKGNEGIATPAFDSGQTIYDGLMAELDAALAHTFTGGSNTNIGTSDYIFGGNVTKWVQFARTLQLKMYLRQVNARADVAQSGVASLWSNGANFLTGAAAMSSWADEVGKYNPMYGNDVAATGLGDANLRASQTLFNYLTNNSDPRLPLIYKPAPNETTLLANKQGDYRDKPAAEANKLSRGQWSATRPVYFFTEAEVLFLRAEALVRYPSLSGNAQELYEAGVKASFALLGADGADALLSGAYSWANASTDEEKIKLIITQKWVSQAMFNPIESFFDRNRTGYPDNFVVSATSSIGDLFPQRLLASDTDEGINNPNCPKGVSVATKVWWAK